MSGVGIVTAVEPSSLATGTKLEGTFSTAEKSAAAETSKAHQMGSTKNISLAEKVGTSEFWRFSPREMSDRSENLHDAMNFWSIGNAAYVVLYVNIDDIRAWSQLYGPAPAVALATFGRKAVWKMQAELLGRPGRPNPGGSGDPDNPNDPDGSGSPGDAADPDGPYRPGGTNDLAAEEYKRTVEAESGRITVSGTIITQIAVIALTLPSLSQTHWVARASWLFSLVSSLLAVYLANNQAWEAGYLLLGNRLRTWIRGHRKGPDDYIKEYDDRDPNFAKLLVRSLVPAPSSVLTVSAPGLLLSASLCFLLIGFGIYLGFMWTRTLDDLAGPDDDRDVFIVYLVSLLFCCGLYYTSDAAHNRKATDTVHGTIQDSLRKFETRLEMCERRRGERCRGTEEKKQQLLLEQISLSEKKHQLLLEQLSVSRQMLNQQEEIQALMKLGRIRVTWEDSEGRTPLTWAAERGQEWVVLALLHEDGVNINTRDNSEWTPLMWAAANGHVAVVRDLLHKGADLSFKDGDQQTALDLARSNGHEPVVTLLQPLMPHGSADGESR